MDNVLLWGYSSFYHFLDLYVFNGDLYPYVPLNNDQMVNAYYRIFCRPFYLFTKMVVNFYEMTI